MKLFRVALLTIISLSAQTGLSPALQDKIDDIIEDIYRIDADELREIIAQDIGPVIHIEVEDLRRIMHNNQQLLVINVLSANWYEDCHIAGSINVPLKELVYTMKDWDRYQPIVVYCALDECDASEKAYILLRCMGFPFVLEYQGGIKEWFQLGYPIQGFCEAPYLHEEGHRMVDCLKSEADTHFNQ